MKRRWEVGKTVLKGDTGIKEALRCNEEHCGIIYGRKPGGKCKR